MKPTKEDIKKALKTSDKYTIATMLMKYWNIKDIDTKPYKDTIDTRR